MEKLVIVGSGCAGMSAAIYAARAGLDPLVLEGPQPGGLITTTSEVENFPAFPEGVNGFDLLWKMREQALKFGTRIEGKTVKSADFTGDVKKLFLENGDAIEAERVIVATGSSPRMTGAKNEEKLWGGKGVSTCATCDGAFFKNKDVVVVGGGDTACEEADFLSRFCASIKLIHRRDAFRASAIMQERVKANAKVELVFNSVVKEVLIGEDGKCAGVVLEDVNTHQQREITCSAMFVAIGHKPNTDAFKDSLKIDESGYIITRQDSLVETDIAGVYAAGDCADKEFRQAITASAMGCMAAIKASQFRK